MMLESAEAWNKASSELLRAIRGKRSQVAFSRRLGYRSNVAADWEGGHRFPDAEVLLRAMSRVHIDVDASFAAFHDASASAATEGIARWLTVLSGSTKQAEISRRTGFSRHQVRRWLRGEARPRVPEFLRLIDGLTGRAQDWVAAFVDIREVPSLHGVWTASQTAARLAFDVPWSSALRIVITTDAYREAGTDAWLREALGIDVAQFTEAVDALLDTALVIRQGDRLVPGSTFTAQPQSSSEDRRRLKAHWARAAADRLETPRPGDQVSLNLVTLSRADLDKVVELQRAYFRELRSLVAASEPEETAALVMMQVLTLG